MSLSKKDAEHVFQSLRGGDVPARGIEAFAVGIDSQRREIDRLLTSASENEGLVKFLRGGYGCGKTFMSNLAIHDAKAKNFVTSFVVVSDNDLQLHKFDQLYHKVVLSLSTTACPTGALGDILDRWIGRIEDELVELGADDDADDFDAKVRAKLDEKLGIMTSGNAPPDMLRVIGAVFDLKQAGKLQDANALLSWLSGSTNVTQSLKKLAGVKGDIGSQDAMGYLRGILAIVRAAGYAGLLIVVDEAETILRMRGDVRKKSLNGIRQICDDAKNYSGLLWMFTGTPDFFDSPKGVKSLEALNDRVQFDDGRGFPSPRQPQLALERFDAVRLRQVALKLRSLHPDIDSDEMEARMPDAVVEKLVDNWMVGFKRNVGVVPRHFLRRFVNMLDQVVSHAAYDPARDVGFEFDSSQLSPEEERALSEGPEEPGFEGATLDI